MRKSGWRALWRHWRERPGADVGAFMWGVRGMDIVVRERLILEQWPGLSIRDQIRASELYRLIRDADELARRSTAR